ncbi:gluconate 2-dehydrogenase subunit 3 family protein [Prosthecomicrobium sp. N25]
MTLAAAITITAAGALLNAPEAWALDVQSLKPETMRTLIQLARDIYPHDKVADRFYAIAVKGHDAKGGKDPAHRALIEDGIAALDKAAGPGGYLGRGWEAERVALLRKIEDTPFFQAVRGDLVVSLYNQQEIWPIFGYEGESYSKGGYIRRGFDDIDWL